MDIVLFLIYLVGVIVAFCYIEGNLLNTNKESEIDYPIVGIVSAFSWVAVVGYWIYNKIKK